MVTFSMLFNAGDRLYVSRYHPQEDDDDASQRKVTEYVGYVHEVRETEALLGFHDR